MNLVLASQEHKHIAWRQFSMDADALLDSCLLIVRGRAFLVVHCHWKHPRLDIHNRYCVVKQSLILEVLHSHSCAHDNKPQWVALSLLRQLVSPQHHSGKQTNEDICVDFPLVSLINNDHSVSSQHWVGTHLVQQNTVCHELNKSALRLHPLVSHLIPYQLSQLGPSLLSNSASQSNCGQSSGLGNTDSSKRVIVFLDQELTYLCALP